MNFNKSNDIEIKLLTDKLKTLLAEKDLSMIPERVFGKLIHKYLTAGKDSMPLKIQMEIQRILENAVTYLVIKRRISGFRAQEISAEPDIHQNYLTDLYLDVLKNELPQELNDPANAVLNLHFIFTDRIHPTRTEAYRLFTVLREWVNMGIQQKKSADTYEHLSLIRVEDIRQRLGISQVTMKKYLKECRVEVIRFSSKELWFTVQSYQHFLNYYAVSYGGH